MRVKSKDEETVQRINQNYDQLLEKEPSAFDHEYEEFINSIKTALFFSEWINEADEGHLLEKYDIRPGD